MPKDQSHLNEDPSLESETLYGDIRSALLDGLRAMPKPWQQMTADEQRQLTESCGQVARHLIRETTLIVAANRFPVVHGKLIKVQVQAKDAMQLQIDISRHDPQRLTVLDTVGKPVLIVIAEPDMFMGERAPPEAGQPNVDRDGVVQG